MRKYLCTLYDGEGNRQRKTRAQFADGPSQAAADAAELHGNERTKAVHVSESEDGEPFQFSVTVATKCESVRYVRGTGPSPE